MWYTRIWEFNSAISKRLIIQWFKSCYINKVFTSLITIKTTIMYGKIVANSLFSWKMVQYVQNTECKTYILTKFRIAILQNIWGIVQSLGDTECWESYLQDGSAIYQIQEFNGSHEINFWR